MTTIEEKIDAEVDSESVEEFESMVEAGSSSSSRSSSSGSPLDLKELILSESPDKDLEEYAGKALDDGSDGLRRILRGLEGFQSALGGDRDVLNLALLDIAMGIKEKVAEATGGEENYENI
jgi:hypothetical protein